jgi:hypothetical protein
LNGQVEQTPKDSQFFDDLIRHHYDKGVSSCSAFQPDVYWVYLQLRSLADSKNPFNQCQIFVSVMDHLLGRFIASEIGF